MKIAGFIALTALTFGAFSPNYSYADDHDDMVEVEEYDVDENDEAENSKPKDEDVLSAQEARELIMSAPEADDATKGTVPDTKLKKYYDIRARQVAYRENVKEFRASLERRRVSYAEPQFAAIENYRETIAKVYAAEGKVAEEDRANQDREERIAAIREKRLKKEAEEAKNGKSSSEDDEVVSVSDESDADNDGTGLTEKPIPVEGEAEDGAPKKKVVTSEDAPDFDPANL